MKTGAGLPELRAALARPRRARCRAADHGSHRAPADRPRVHRRRASAPWSRARWWRGASRSTSKVEVFRGACRRRCAACRCTATPSRARSRRPAHRGESPGRRAGRDRARRRPGARAARWCRRCCVDATLELLGGRAAAAQDARPRALPRRHPGGDGARAPRGPAGARARRTCLSRPLPPGGARGGAARRPLRRALLLAHRHDRRRHRARHRAAALQAQGAARSPTTCGCSPRRAAAAVLEEHLRQAGAAGARVADLRARDALRPAAAPAAPRRAPAGGRRSLAVDREWYLHRDASDRLRSQALAPPRGVPRREPPAGRHLPGGAAEPGRPCPGAGLRPAPRRAGGGRGRQERARPGAPRLARDPAQSRAAAGRRRARGRLPRAGRRAPEPGGGAGPARASRARRSTSSSRSWSPIGRCCA